MSAETTMRCEDVAPYLSAYADGELPEPLHSEVAEHVETCEACSETLARYAEIDSLLAHLPRSAPPPEMLDHILEAVASEDEQAERRRVLQSTWGLTPFKRKLTEMDMPQVERSSPRNIRPTRRSRWVSVALPAIAALLLISVTLVTFRWLPSKGGTVFPPTNQPTATPAPGSVTLADTLSAVNAIKAQLSFKPVLPTYLPDGATLANVTIGPRETEISDHVLDVYWSIGASANVIHLHEAPVSIGLSGYTDTATPAQVAWQIGNAPWRTVRPPETASKNLAVAQTRAGVAIALDVSIPVNSPQTATGQAMLRLMSLSMDSTYKVIPVAPDGSSARILPLKIQEMVAHYTAVALSGNGPVAWREDVYVAPCASTADPCQVRKSYSLGASGPPLYTDIVGGQRLLHLDEAQQIYSWLPMLPADQGANLNTTTLPKLFYLANTYLSSGILWYEGQTNYKGQRVYDLLWTNAPTRTHVYVSTTTHQVVAMSVDSHANIQKGGPIAGTGSLSCLRYTVVEYIVPDTSTDALLAQTIPTGYTESQEPQVSLTC